LRNSQENNGVNLSKIDVLPTSSVSFWLAPVPKMSTMMAVSLGPELGSITFQSKAETSSSAGESSGDKYRLLGASCRAVFTVKS
jgi:hypothetical protein